MAKWNYTLKNGVQLREAIHNEDAARVLEELKVCYKELLKAKQIDGDDYDSYIDQIEGYDEDDIDEFTVDYELSEFYDLCDNLRIWVEF